MKPKLTPFVEFLQRRDPLLAEATPLPTPATQKELGNPEPDFSGWHGTDYYELGKKVPVTSHFRRVDPKWSDSQRTAADHPLYGSGMGQEIPGAPDPNIQGSTAPGGSAYFGKSGEGENFTGWRGEQYFVQGQPAEGWQDLSPDDAKSTMTGNRRTVFRNGYEQSF
jgi:hypothetical protein